MDLISTSSYGETRSGTAQAIAGFADVVRQFQVQGAFVNAQPHGSGHINHSSVVVCQTSNGVRCYLLQRLNTTIFKDVGSLMDNVERVTSHVASKLAGDADAERRVLTPVRTVDEGLWHRQPDGSCWRMFHMIERAHSFDEVVTTQQAFRAAQAFGHFQQLLSDLPAPRLHETIPAFHDTAKRFVALEHAVAADSADRVVHAASEIAFAMERRAICNVLHDSNLPERVTHNDTKLNNVLFDDATGEALCVVDLDTVMPGLALHDFGDMVRTATSPTAEDEQDLGRVGMRLPFFQALVQGYLSSAGSFLTRDEKRLLPLAGKVIAFEQAVRFLTDYLQGDVYYKVGHPRQNLDRCRTQIKLVQSMEEQQERMHAIVESVQGNV